MRCEMQTTSSRIWTRVTVSIPNDNNHYTAIEFVSEGASFILDFYSL